jgi:signal transduction histidine kinase
MAIGLVLLALICILVPGLWLWHGLDARLKELEELESEELRLLLARRSAELRRAVEGSVARLARELSTDGGLVGALPAAGGPGDPDTARSRLAEMAGGLLAHTDLDLLWLVDEDGRILSCGHWQARAGTLGTELLRVRPGHPLVRPVRVGDEQWMALQMSEALRVGGRRLLVVGGARLDRAVRERMGAGREVGLALVDAEAGLLAAVPWPFPVALSSPRLRRAITGGEEMQAALPDATGGHLVAALPLIGDGQVQGSLVAVRTLAPLAAWRRNLLATLAGVGLMAAGLAAFGGVWLARRMAGPVRELTEVTTRMADGELNLALPVRSADEVGRLTAAFNRMAEAVRHGRRELARSERLAAWRDAARRMAHEVKNPLAPIKMSVENLRRARAVSPRAFAAHFEEECRTILEEVEALRRLVDEFSRFSRLPAPEKQPADPAELVRHAVDLYGPSLADVTIDCRIAPDLPQISLDPGLMGQVLKNLLANALEAVGDKEGRIVVECSRENEEVVFAVSDNGPGVPEEIRDRLFEPQVTSKSRGSGLGLAISRQIVEQHGGRITVASGSWGSRFQVRLPLSAAEQGAHVHGPDPDR